MPLSTTDTMQDLFVEATRHTLTRSLRTGEDWDRFNTIVRETSERLDAEQAAHARDYPARIAEAKEIILRETHGIRLDHPPPSWVDKRSTADALQSKAEHRVRQDYDGRVAAIKTDEMDRYRSLTNDKRANIGDDFALRGTVVCDCCETPLRSSWTKGNTKLYPYYLCQTKGCDAYGKSIARDKLEGEVGEIIKTLEPTQGLIAMASAIFRQVWDTRRDQAKALRASGKRASIKKSTPCLTASWRPATRRSFAAMRIRWKRWNASAPF